MLYHTGISVLGGWTGNWTSWGVVWFVVPALAGLAFGGLAATVGFKLTQQPTRGALKLATVLSVIAVWVFCFPLCHTIETSGWFKPEIATGLSLSAVWGVLLFAGIVGVCAYRELGRKSGLISKDERFLSRRRIRQACVALGFWFWLLSSGLAVDLETAVLNPNLDVYAKALLTLVLPIVISILIAKLGPPLLISLFEVEEDSAILQERPSAQKS
ncbi:MAG: hypothetical protein AAF612_03845 [Planctomycetota bacterium]